MRVKNINVLDQVFKDGVFYESIELEHAFGFCVIFTTESASGLTATAKLQASLDGVTWVDLTGTSQTVSTNGSYLWNVTDVMYSHLRVSTTVSAGDGVFSIRANVKGV